ncbi:hypothetical protein [Photobacterium salinisoli]|uniref:hypothetical protein n=1 Tax=Photobacterium salinisoli TaxID=1616783 RepID=UPI000EA34477|nr:hypothetical protein [Photobacterium salinisoli]
MFYSKRTNPLYFMLVVIAAIYSSYSESSLEINGVKFNLYCNDLHQGEYITDKFGTYPKYEMEDGYNGTVSLSIIGDGFTITKDGKLSLSGALNSSLVKVDRSSGFILGEYDTHYYIFDFNEKLSLINYVKKNTDESVEDVFFECEHHHSIDEINAINQYLRDVINFK